MYQLSTAAVCEVQVTSFQVIPQPHHPEALIVIVSVAASVVIVTFVQATNVNVSLVESATTLLCQDTAIVEKRF